MCEWPPWPPWPPWLWPWGTPPSVRASVMLTVGVKEEKPLLVGKTANPNTEHSHDIDGQSNGRSDEHQLRVHIWIALNDSHDRVVGQNTSDPPEDDNRDEGTEDFGSQPAIVQSLAARISCHPERENADEEHGEVAQQVGAFRSDTETVSQYTAHSLDEHEDQAESRDDDQAKSSLLVEFHLLSVEGVTVRKVTHDRKRAWGSVVRWAGHFAGEFWVVGGRMRRCCPDDWWLLNEVNCRDSACCTILGCLTSCGWCCWDENSEHAGGKGNPWKKRRLCFYLIHCISTYRIHTVFWCRGTRNGRILSLWNSLDGCEWMMTFFSPPYELTQERKKECTSKSGDAAHKRRLMTHWQMVSVGPAQDCSGLTKSRPELIGIVRDC